MNFELHIRDKHCNVIGSPVIVCGNSDYTIDFHFLDEEWSAVAEKTARFSYVQDGVRRYKDVKMTDNSVRVPPVYNTREVCVGVFSGELVTTTPARIPCEKSIACDCGGDLPPGQYERLRDELTGYINMQLGVIENGSY